MAAQSALRCRPLAHGVEKGVVLKAVLGDVGDIHGRLGGEQEDVAQFEQLIRLQAHGAHRLTGVQALAHPLQQLLARQDFLVARLGLLGGAIQGLFHRFQIRQGQLGVDDLNIP